MDGDGDLDLLAASYGSSSGTSTTVSVKLNGGTALATVPGRLAGLTLLPNPAHDAVLLAGADAGATVRVFDALGRIRLTTTVAADGTAPLALPAGLAPGVYLVRTSSQVLRLLID